MSLARTVIGYKTRTISKPIYEDEFVKNLTIETYYEATNTNPNSMYIPLNICLERYNRSDLCTYINSGCSICISRIYVKKARNSL